MRQLTLDKILTPKELDAAVFLFLKHQRDGKFATMAADLIIEPNIERINRDTGQKNEPLYLAFLVQYLLTAIKLRQTA